MTSKRLYLIRHGHTVWNGPPLRFQGQMDSSLSEIGRADAVALGKRMPYQPDRIVSSPALRCRQTVDCLFGRKPDEIEPRCIEIGLGWCEGLLATEAAKIDAEAVRIWQEAPWEGSPWGGESLEVLQTRVVAGVSDIVAGIKPDERVFLAVHGGVLRTLICYINDLPLSEYTNIPMANLTLLELTADQVIRGDKNIRNVTPEEMI
ncbi:MAG: histidine phosphatase family protein [Rhodospirillaceae bacterium]|jgi:alpha-ribazole phosphatase|nr:histidine phosphatase family protein [Rhodospirillaceae bacterium]MBT4042360.1 histidine phosphatase family protein [Rhodospirillaceae bacterium]MBT4690565.1 histidine phosphatase family protein [Rhodospirillaceae bacterium]MBT5083874.1 histidine phosphatase family protein [Rhodospirillaceae bacterium]MBT5526634.1 histidine phosphatase family protein [Rhodospirillaceae bacterium]